MRVVLLALALTVVAALPGVAQTAPAANAPATSAPASATSRTPAYYSNIRGSLNVFEPIDASGCVADTQSTLANGKCTFTIRISTLEKSMHHLACTLTPIKDATNYAAYTLTCTYDPQ